MIPVLYRSHVLALGENADEVRFIVESAVIAYFRMHYTRDYQS